MLRFEVVERVRYEILVEDCPGRVPLALASEQWHRLSLEERGKLAIGVPNRSFTQVIDPTPRWSPENQAAAVEDGWALVSYLPDRGYIVRRDNKFASDRAAELWVRFQAAQGSTLHVGALAYIDHINGVG